jgi:hypothetical protein
VTPTERVLVAVIRRLMVLLASLAFAPVRRPSVDAGILRTLRETREIVKTMEALQ